MRAQLDTPDDVVAITGGQLVSSRVMGGRGRGEYRLREPGKFFFTGARAFLDEHRYGQATTEDLRAALEQAGGRDLEPYFERWIYGIGLPALLWTSGIRETPDSFETTVQVQPQDRPGALPLEISLETGEDPVVRRVVLEPAGGRWRIVTPVRVRGVEVTENRGILAETKKVRRLPPPAQR
jgi:hypothetical protein